MKGKDSPVAPRSEIFYLVKNGQHDCHSHGNQTTEGVRRHQRTIKEKIKYYGWRDDLMSNHIFTIVKRPLTEI